MNIYAVHWMNVYAAYFYTAYCDISFQSYLGWKLRWHSGEWACAMNQEVSVRVLVLL